MPNFQRDGEGELHQRCGFAVESRQSSAWRAGETPDQDASGFAPHYPGFMTLGVLDPKTVEFIAIAVDASCTHMYAPGVRRHVRKALELGATKEEITAVLQCVSVLGIHTMSLGAPILQEELAAREPVTAPAAL